MIDELNQASFLLDNALDRYFKACSMIRDSYLQNESLGTIPYSLSQRVTSEASVVGGYEVKLKEAKAAINRARNLSTKLVPVNSLPPEVLARIFQFALGENNIGNMHRHPRLDRTEARDTTSSEVLSHVCSYWRRVTLNSPQFWTRIDLSPCPRACHGLLPRSAVFAKRASGMLLDIYVTDPNRGWSGSATLDHFIKAIAPRIRSINLRIYQTIRIDVYRNALSACLSSCVPGTLTTLIAIREPDNVSSFVFFDVPDLGIPNHGVGFYQQMYTHAHEEVLLSITTMRLYGFYPFWTSKAYHGLVELRLTKRTTDAVISESHLQGILQASPSLRILEFSLNVGDPIPEGPTAPVRLGHLEVLNLSMMDCSFLPTFLRVIEPGSRPLQMSLSSASNEYDPRLSFVVLGAFYLFFSRANIVTLHANNFNKDEIAGILGLCPHLQTLAWDGYNIPSEFESDALISHSQLRNLYLTWCEVELDIFSRWINLPALEHLVFSRCLFYRGNGSSRLEESQVQIELPGVNPIVSFVENNPIEGWELFDPDS